MCVKTTDTNDKLEEIIKLFPDVDLEVLEVRDCILRKWRDGRVGILRQAFNLEEPEIYEHVARYFPQVRNIFKRTQVTSNLISKIQSLENRYTSQKEMLLDFNLTRMTYYRWVTGQTEPKLHNLVEISKKAGVSLDWLVGD